VARVAVTGGAGFIGSHLVDRLIKDDHEVLVLDNLCRGSKANVHPDATLHYVDLAKAYPFQLAQLMDDAEIVFHLAAKVTGIEYNRHNQLDMMQSNLAINWRVTEAVRWLKPSLYFFVSTACIYPHDAPVPTSEEFGAVCNPEPTNFGYGVAKWVGEQQAKFLFDEEGVPTVITRFFNAIGPRDYYDPETSHVIPALIDRAFHSVDKLEVWGSGDQTRVFVDARDIASVLTKLIDCPTASLAYPINIGHDDEISIRDAAETVNRMVAGGKLELVFDTDKPDGYPRRAADATRLKLLIGEHYWIPFWETVLDMIDDYEERFDVS